jgi:hypothetical protein
MKRCRRCSKDLDCVCFYKQSSATDGLQSYCRECSHKSVSQYWKDNPGKKALSDAKYNAEHKDEKKARDKFYASTHKREQNHYKRLHQLKAYVPERANIQAIKEFYINCPDGYEVDHVIELWQGGTHEVNNLQYLSHGDNMRKSWRLRKESECNV